MAKTHDINHGAQKASSSQSFHSNFESDFTAI